MNTDLELAYDIDVDNKGNGTQCEIGNDTKEQLSCPIASTMELVEIYAKVYPVIFQTFRNIVSIIKCNIERVELMNNINNFQSLDKFLTDFKKVYEKMMTVKIKYPLKELI